MKQLPDFPRYELVYRKACEFLVSQRVSLLPVDPFRIIRKNGWGLVSFRQLARRMDVPEENLAAAMPSGDGCTVFNGRHYCIAYNGEIEIFSRVVFTLFHEIGHIVLGHFQDYDCAEPSSPKLRVLESEANYFASNVMAPSVVIDQCGLCTVERLRCACCMSYDAAETRLLHFKKWVPTPMDRKVQDAMFDYIRLTSRPRSEKADLDALCNELLYPWGAGWKYPGV